MKNKIISILLCFVIVGPSQVRAASQDECAIWLCFPIGFAFPSCHSAHAAMVKRLFEFKGPAPSFSSCEAPNSKNPNDYTMDSGSAIKMGAGNLGAGKIIDNGFCNQRDSGPEQPLGCTATLRMYKLYENGIPMGMTYYRDPQGQDYVRDPATDLIISVRNLRAQQVETGDIQ